MRSRYIKPGIMSNEDLAELGMPAYILFTGLWMIADREGRLEDRPRRIKALTMPMWDEISSADVENLCGKLADKGFIHRYTTDGGRYIQVVNWRKHQNPDPREKASTIPAPPPLSPVKLNGSEQTVETHRQDTVITMSSRVGNGYMGTEGCTSSVEGECRGGETPPPPTRTPDPEYGPGYPIPEGPITFLDLPPEQTDPVEPDDEPDEEPVPWPDDLPPKPPPDRPQPTAKRRAPVKKPPTTERRRAGPRSVTDFWPHAPADVQAVRNALDGLREYVSGLPPPDDGIILRVLDAARGGTGLDVQRLMVHLYRREKFRDMRSWGLLPMLVSQWFRAA